LAIIKTGRENSKILIKRGSEEYLASLHLTFCWDYCGQTNNGYRISV